MNVFMRHFAANPAISENGESVGGVVGFLRGLKNLINGLYPKEVIVVWEGGGSPRRRAIDPNYKHSRRPVKLNRFYEEIPTTASGRNQQINMLIQLLRFGPIKQLYISDCEADDVIGYLANFELRNKKTVIASSDHDYYQLVNDNITIWSPGQKKIITQKDILKSLIYVQKIFVSPGVFAETSQMVSLVHQELDLKVLQNALIFCRQMKIQRLMI